MKRINLKKRNFNFCEECGGLGAFEVWYGENWEYMTMLPCAKCDGWKLWWKEKPKKFWTREEILKNPKLKLKDPFGRDWKKEVGEKKKEEAVEERREEIAERQKKEEEREVKTENWRKEEKKEGKKRKKSELELLDIAILEIIFIASLRQKGPEIHITIKKILEILETQYKKVVSKTTVIKRLNFLVDNHFISRQVYVKSKGRGTIQKRTTYRLLPKAMRFVAGRAKFLGYKLPMRHSAIKREVDRWLKKEAKKLALIEKGEGMVHMKRWLLKQGFKLIKCSHPWLLMVEPE